MEAVTFDFLGSYNRPKKALNNEPYPFLAL